MISVGFAPAAFGQAYTSVFRAQRRWFAVGVEVHCEAVEP